MQSQVVPSPEHVPQLEAEIDIVVGLYEADDGRQADIDVGQCKVVLFDDGNRRNLQHNHVEQVGKHREEKGLYPGEVGEKEFLNFELLLAVCGLRGVVDCVRKDNYQYHEYLNEAEGDQNLLIELVLVVVAETEENW